MTFDVLKASEGKYKKARSFYLMRLLLRDLPTTFDKMRICIAISLLAAMAGAVS